MMSERKKALMRVQTYGFALDEAALFLDTHKDDAQAMQYYRETLMQYNAAMSDYISKFGPLRVPSLEMSVKIRVVTPSFSIFPAKSRYMQLLSCSHPAVLT